MSGRQSFSLLIVMNVRRQSHGGLHSRNRVAVSWSCWVQLIIIEVRLIAVPLDWIIQIISLTLGIGTVASCLLPGPRVN